VGRKSGDFAQLGDMIGFFEVDNLDSNVLKTRVITISEVLDSHNLQMFNFIVSRLNLV